MRVLDSAEIVLWISPNTIDQNSWNSIKLHFEIFLKTLKCHSFVNYDFRKIVYYVPKHTMRVIAWRATMLAGDRSQGVVES